MTSRQATTGQKLCQQNQFSTIYEPWDSYSTSSCNPSLELESGKKQQSTHKGVVMKMKLQTCAAIAVLALLLGAPSSAKADAVGDWNAIAVQATITGARPGPTGILDIAMVQAAVYDAVQAIEQDFKPYHTEIPGASGSPIAATAKAAHDVR